MDENTEFPVNPYPIDFDALQMGDIVTEEQITHYCQQAPGTTAFQFGQMKLQGEIERRLADRDQPLYAVIEAKGNTLRILSDAEGSECAWKRVQNHFAGAQRNTKRLLRVNTSNLTHNQKATHERRAMICSLQVQGARENRRKAIAEIKKNLKAIEQSDGDDLSAPCGALV